MWAASFYLVMAVGVGIGHWCAAAKPNAAARQVAVLGGIFWPVALIALLTMVLINKADA